MPVADPERGAAFEALFCEHVGAVRAYALRRAPAEVAQDVVAETFLIVWRRLDEVPAQPLPWLYGVARRVLANQRRGERRGAALGERLAAAEPPQPSGDPAERLGEREAVRAALRRLGERDREALMLVAWEGLAPEQAARAAGCSRGTFAVRLHRARARLARELRVSDRAPTPRPLDPDPQEASDA
jgi:RNA polymerase sigma-70 factor (ECF subfamily)